MEDREGRRSQGSSGPQTQVVRFVLYAIENPVVANLLLVTSYLPFCAAVPCHYGEIIQGTAGPLVAINLIAPDTQFPNIVPVYGILFITGEIWGTVFNKLAGADRICHGSLDKPVSDPQGLSLPEVPFPA